MNGSKPLLPNIANSSIYGAVSTMNISLPHSLRSYVDEQISVRGYATSSEYVRELIRKDQDIQSLRNLLLQGAAGKATHAADSEYFKGLRNRIGTSEHV